MKRSIISDNTRRTRANQKPFRAPSFQLPSPCESANLPLPPAARTSPRHAPPPTRKPELSSYSTQVEIGPTLPAWLSAHLDGSTGLKELLRVPPGAAVNVESALGEVLPVAARPAPRPFPLNSAATGSKYEVSRRAAAPLVTCAGPRWKPGLTAPEGPRRVFGFFLTLQAPTSSGTKLRPLRRTRHRCW